MVELFRRKHSRSEISERTGALQQVAGDRAARIRRQAGARRARPRVPYRRGARLSGRSRSRVRSARSRVSGHPDRLALAHRAAPSRSRLARGDPRLGLLALVHRPARHLRPRSGAGARDRQRRAVHLPGDHRDRLSAARPDLADPARLVGYGEHWQGDACTLWAEGEVAQTAVFGENPGADAADRGGARRHGHHRFRSGREPRLSADLAHAALPLQLGWPLLDAGAELLVPSRAIVHTVHDDLHAQGVGYRIRGRRRPTSASRSMSTTWSRPRTAWRPPC